MQAKITNRGRSGGGGGGGGGGGDISMPYLSVGLQVPTVEVTVPILWAVGRE